MSPESAQPPYKPHEEANIRQIMEDRGISFAEAREVWDHMKAQSELDKRNSQNEE